MRCTIPISLVLTCLAIACNRGASPVANSSPAATANSVSVPPPTRDPPVEVKDCKAEISGTGRTDDRGRKLFHVVFEAQLESSGKIEGSGAVLKFRGGPKNMTFGAKSAKFESLADGRFRIAADLSIPPGTERDVQSAVLMIHGLEKHVVPVVLE